MAETHFDVKNLIVGSAMLYTAPVGTPAPVQPPNAGAMIVPGTLWVPLGYTDAGVKVDYSFTVKVISVDELNSPAYVLPDKETCKITVGIAEVTLENLNRVSAMSTYTNTPVATGQAGTATLQFGSKTVLTEASYLLIGAAPQGFQRMINVYRAIATSNLGFTYKRAEKVFVPAEFTGLAYSANTVGNQLLQIIDKEANGL